MKKLRFQIISLFLFIFVLASLADATRRGKYRIKSRAYLHDQNNDKLTSLSLKPPKPKEPSKDEEYDESLAKEPHVKDNHEKRPALTNEEFQARVLDTLEEIRSLSIQNFIQNYLLLAEKLTKYIN